MAHSSFLNRLVACGALIALLLGATSVSAAGSQPNLAIRPVDGEGYIELTLEPGAVQELAVELGNYGDQAAMADTYAADVYSLVNGGMGVRLKDEPTSGTTRWVEYPAHTLTLDPRTAVQRTFMLRVPPDAAPGEYLTSIVLQSVPADLTSGDSPVVLKQVVRQAMAIAITVPGPQSAAFEVGAISHHSANGTSFVVVEVRNTGNVRVRPNGEIRLHDTAGVELSRYPLELGSLYAGTSTTIEVPFAGVLPEGGYTVSLELSDPSRGAQMQVTDRPLRVEPAPTPAPVSEGSVPQPAPLSLPEAESGASAPTVEDGAGTSYQQLLSPPELIFGAAMLLLLSLLLWPSLRRRR